MHSTQADCGAAIRGSDRLDPETVHYLGNGSTQRAGRIADQDTPLSGLRRPGVPGTLRYKEHCSSCCQAFFPKVCAQSMG